MSKVPSKVLSSGSIKTCVSWKIVCLDILIHILSLRNTSTVYVFITEIFWLNNWQSIFDVVERLCQLNQKITRDFKWEQEILPLKFTDLYLLFLNCSSYIKKLAIHIWFKVNNWHRQLNQTQFGLIEEKIRQSNQK